MRGEEKKGYEREGWFEGNRAYNLKEPVGNSLLLRTKLQNFLNKLRMRLFPNSFYRRNLPLLMSSFEYGDPLRSFFDTSLR